MAKIRSMLQTKLKALAATTLFGSFLLSGQEAVPSATPRPAPLDAVALDWQNAFSRWLTVDNFTFSARYRGITDTEGVHTYSQAQQRSLLEGSLKLDKKAKFSVHFRLSSGHYFDWAYADFAGGGTVRANQLSIPSLPEADRLDAINSGSEATRYPSGGFAFLPRQLYLSAEPTDGVVLQYGSLGFNRGVNTEITSYDEDGYLAGGRLLLRKPKQLVLDEISVTYGYVGDIFTPNFFERYQRLGQSNYHQFLVRKTVTPWLEVSADYTHHLVDTWREAALLKTKWSKAADSIRFEAYQRPKVLFVDTDRYNSGNGWAITADKTVRKIISLQAGFADIDTNYDVYSASGNNAIWAFALNGDQYGIGKRPFVRATIKVRPYLSLFGFYTHLVDFNYDRDGFIWNRTALNTGIQIDFKKLFKLDRAL